MANSSGLLSRPEEELTERPRTQADIPRRPTGTGPDMVSRRVRRNRFIALLIVLALIAAGLWLSLGRGQSPTRLSPASARSSPCSSRSENESTTRSGLGGRREARLHGLRGRCQLPFGEHVG